jgi:competence protein ComEA
MRSPYDKLKATTATTIWPASTLARAFRGFVLFSTLAATGSAVAAPPPKQLPDGPGKEAMERVCTACHGAEIVMGRGLTKDGWTQVVEEMIGRGAQGSEDDFAQIVDYLAKNFPPQPDGAKRTAVPTAQKVNVNKAGADDLKAALNLTADQAGSIIAYRQKNGEFKTLDDLKKVPGLDGAKLDSEKEKISYSD